MFTEMYVIFLHIFRLTFLKTVIQTSVWKSWRTQLVVYQMKMYAKVKFLFKGVVLIALGSFNKTGRCVLKNFM